MSGLLKNAKETFDFFDLNKDGYLSKGEFVSVVNILNGEIGVGASKEYFEKADLNGDNKISFGEFKKILERL